MLTPSSTTNPAPLESAMHLALPVVLSATLLGLCGAPSAAAAAIAVVPAEPTIAAAPVATTPLIEIAILLDNSGSMSGLIDQARARLWSIVSSLARTAKGGKSPDLRVALYQYGNPGMAILVPLTDDLDAVSKALFAITIQGGDEHCGAIIQRAVNELAWQPGDHYRAIFIAGNEPFTQGSVAPSLACQAAAAKGIVVNTIHCGSASEGQSGGWIDGARLADGESLNIDQNHQEVAITAPQDARIAAVNTALNGTYLAYGADGAVAAANQVEQDANAAKSGAASFNERALAKSAMQYCNSRWDLVDALRDKKVDLAAVPADTLPVEMRAMDAAQRRAHVEAKSAERGTLQQELATLATARQEFVVSELKQRGVTGGDGFGEAVRQALGRQLTAKGFTQSTTVELGAKPATK